MEGSGRMLVEEEEEEEEIALAGSFGFFVAFCFAHKQT